MPITIHAYRRAFYLSNAESDFTAQDGDVLEKTINSDYTITIPDGATVTLQGADINDESKVTNGTHASITCLGDATIILDGNCTVRSFGSGYPAIKLTRFNYIPILFAGWSLLQPQIELEQRWCQQAEREHDGH